ncbi:MAG: ABC transporter permease [Eubacteriales bacterium]|jgi:hypothetical protein
MFDAKQIRVYIRKDFRLMCNWRGLFNLICSFAIPMVISLVFLPDKMMVKYQTTRMACFALVCAGIWIGLFNSVTSICAERKVVKFEYQMKGLKLPSYVMARVIAEAIICAIEAALITIVIYLRYGDGITDKLLQMPLIFVTFLLIVFSSDMLALIISAAAKKSAGAMTVMPMILIVELIFSNFIQKLDTIGKGVKAISYLTISRWGTTAFFTIANRSSLVAEKGTQDWTIFNSDSGAYQFSGVTIAKCWGLLILFAVVYIIFAMQLLKLVKKDQR